MITRTEKSLLFIIPWGSHWIIGTTDTDWDLDLAHPAASQTDIDYLLDHANALLADPLTREDVVGVYAGLRPLLAGESDSTSKLSREHAVASPVRGLTVIAGGKYTTYRVMAKDAVDAAVHGLERTVPRPRMHRATCRWPAPTATRRCGTPRQLVAAQPGCASATVEHLLGRYGSLIHEVLALIAERPELGEPLAGAPEYLQGRGGLRGHARGRPAPGGHARPGAPASRSRCPTAASRPPREVAALVAPVLGLGRRRRRRRGRALRPARGGRARVAAPARRPDRRRRPARRAGRPPRQLIRLARFPLLALAGTFNRTVDRCALRQYVQPCG